MPKYEVDFEYKITEYGVTSLEASDIDQADEFAREYVYETYPDVENLSIVAIREIK